MNFELPREFGEGLFAVDGGKGHLHFESRAGFRRGHLGIGRLLCSAKWLICRQKSQLTMLFRFPEPPLCNPKRRNAEFGMLSPAEFELAAQ